MAKFRISFGVFVDNWTNFCCFKLPNIDQKYCHQVTLKMLSSRRDVIFRILLLLSFIDIIFNLKDFHGVRAFSRNRNPLRQQNSPFSCQILRSTTHSLPILISLLLSLSHSSISLYFLTLSLLRYLS